MSVMKLWLSAATAVVLLAASAGTAHAARIRYHFVPVNGGPAVVLTPATPGGAPGERLSWIGRAPEPYNCLPPPPTAQVCFVHPCTGRQLTVPLALPPDTPQIEHRRNWTYYNYGSYAVEIHFLEDGSLDVIYNSGLWREP
jgi:hypothetical protein